MEVKQVNSLKLNAKKINSVLIRGNSNVKKLRAVGKLMVIIGDLVRCSYSKKCVSLIKNNKSQKLLMV